MEQLCAAVHILCNGHGTAMTSLHHVTAFPVSENCEIAMLPQCESSYHPDGILTP